MSAGGAEVGRVSIRVVPNTDNFKRKVEQEAAKLRDLEVDIEADLDTDKAEAGAKQFEKRKRKTKFSADLDTAQLKSKMKAATRELRKTVKVAAELDSTKLHAQLSRLRTLIDKNLSIEASTNFNNILAEARILRTGLQKHLGNIKAGIDQTALARSAVAAARKANALIRSSVMNVRIGVSMLTAPAVAKARALRQAVQAVLLDVRVGVSLLAAPVVRQAAKVKALAERVLGKIRAGVEIVTAPLVAAASAAKAKAKAILGKIRSEVELVTGPMVAAAEAARRLVKSRLGVIRSKIEAKMDIDGNGFVAKARAYAKAASAGLKVTAKMDIDHRRLARSAQHAGSVLSTAVGPVFRMFGGQFFRELAMNFSRIKGMLASITMVASSLLVPIAAIGNAAGAAFSSMIKLAGGMLPAALGAAAIGITGIMKSFSGFGDALASSDLSEFNESIAELGPNAQSAARAVWDMKEAFNEASSGAQEGFWGAITASMQPLVGIAESFGSAVTRVSEQAGEAANGMVEFLGSATGMKAMNELINNSADATASIAEAFFGAVPGITALGAAASGVFSKIADGLNQSLSGWSDRIVQEFESGQLEASINEQIASVQAFGAVMSDIGGIISGVWSAAASASDGFLGPVREAIAATNEWVNSSEGMEVLSSYFDKMGQVVSSLSPVIGELAQTVVGTLAPAMADFITAAAPGMATFAEGFGALAKEIAPIMGQIGSAIGNVLNMIGPLLPALAPIIPAALGVAAAFKGFSVISAVLGPVVGIVGSLSAPVLIAVAAIAGLAVAFASVPGAAQGLMGAFQSVWQALQPVGEILLNLGKQILSALQPAFEAMVPVITQFVTAVGQIITAITPIIATIAQFVGTIIGLLVPVFVSLMPVVSAVISIFVSLVQAIAPIINVVLQVAAGFLSLLATILSFVASALGSILSFVAGVIAGFVGMVGTVIGVVSGWVSSILSFVGNLVSSFISTVTSMWTSTVSAFASGVAKAVGEVARMPGRARSALGNVGSVLVSSGKALIQGFVNGIRSMIGAVADAASSVVQAARDFFPFSPAKRGPFSGRGYTTYSGKALTKDFAGGILSGASDVRSATESLMQQANAPFEQHHKNKILQPVLESNAKKIADAREKELKANENHEKRLAEIRAKGSKNAGEQIVKENKKHAEKIEKIRKDLDDSLEAPDYSDIDLSFRKYYIEGLKEMMSDELLNSVKREKLVEKTRQSALASVKEARATFGNHPVLAQVELNVNSKHFEDSVYKAVEESGISAVPVDFVIANLDQLKSDLGMGDGVISRAIDAALDWNWNDTDAKRYRDNAQKTEVHYHVEDMQEAIRRENLRVRKQLMKTR